MITPVKRQFKSCQKFLKHSALECWSAGVLKNKDINPFVITLSEP